MKARLIALLEQFAQLRPQIRVDADQAAAAFVVSLEQAIDAADEPAQIDPVNLQLESIRSRIEEVVLMVEGGVNAGKELAPVFTEVLQFVRKNATSEAKAAG